MRECAESGSTKKHMKRREESYNGIRDTNPAWVSSERADERNDREGLPSERRVWRTVRIKILGGPDDRVDGEINQEILEGIRKYTKKPTIEKV